MADNIDYKALSEKAAAEITSLKSALASLNDQLHTKDEMIENLNDQIVTLKAAALKNVAAVQSAAPAKAVIPQKPVKVAGKEYVFKVPKFNLNGAIVTAEEASTDKEILAEILKMEGQGILKPLA